MDLEMRQITKETFSQFLDTIGVTFQFDPTEEEAENFIKVDEVDRMFAAIDNEAMVATFGAYTYELSTPGGSVAAGGLTAVSVLPTHRRRGVLTSMMRRHYADAGDHGEPVSILWASEWPIYGRFGYGQATQGATLEIDTRHAALIAGEEPPGRCRMVDKQEAEKVFPGVYERVQPRPGMLNRPPQHWKHRHFFDPESWRSGATANRFTVYEENGTVDGYVRWRGKENWEGGIAASSAQVGELMAATPAAERALWQFLLNLDLTQTVKAGRRSVDEGLLMMLVDRRRLKRTVNDALWVAILDVPAALAARRYAIDGEVVIEVGGSFTEGVDGRYRLVGGRDGAECSPTDAEPDISMSASELGALYLGGSRLAPMVTWGTVRADEETVRKVDAMFAWDELPWCPEVF
ncbi:MAG: GNAT family N-acetyltransferase [Acidimicrobiia bacterium]